MEVTQKCKQIDLVKKLMVYLGLMNIFVGFYPFYLADSGVLSHMGSAAIVVVMLGIVSVIIGLGHLIAMVRLNYENNRGYSISFSISIISILVNLFISITFLATLSEWVYVLILILNIVVMFKLSSK